MKKILFILMLITSLNYADGHKNYTHKMDRSHTNVNFEVTAMAKKVMF